MLEHLVAKVMGIPERRLKQTLIMMLTLNMTCFVFQRQIQGRDYGDCPPSPTSTPSPLRSSNFLFDSSDSLQSCV